MTLYTRIDSPLGEMLLVGEPSPTAQGGTALTALSLPGQRGAAMIRNGWTEDAAAFAAIAGQLGAYFAGGRTAFDLEFATGGGTEFQRRVWKAVEAVPYGVTSTYGRIAEEIGAPRAAVRAVGTAIGANPLLVVRPCHRVIGASGALTGYAAGLERKQRLLELEGALPA